MEEQQNLYAQYVENVYQNLTELGGGRLGKTFWRGCADRKDRHKKAGILVSGAGL